MEILAKVTCRDGTQYPTHPPATLGDTCQILRSRLNPPSLDILVQKNTSFSSFVLTGRCCVTLKKSNTKKYVIQLVTRLLCAVQDKEQMPPPPTTPSRYNNNRGGGGYRGNSRGRYNSNTRGGYRGRGGGGRGGPYRGGPPRNNSSDEVKRPQVTSSNENGVSSPV